MGNRAVIAFTNEGKKDKKGVGIYLHWNGGRDSVEGFLQAAKDYDLRNGTYGVARLIQIICNAIPGTLSVGVGIVEKLDCNNFDNGLYWIDQEFNIVGREFLEEGVGEEQDEYPLDRFVKHVKKHNDFVFEKDPYKRLKKLEKGAA